MWHGLPALQAGIAHARPFRKSRRCRWSRRRRREPAERSIGRQAMRRDPDADRQLRDPNRLGEFERAPTVGPRLREGLTDHEWQRRKRERRQAKAPGVARMLTTATDAVKAAKRLAKTADKLADR